MLATSGDPLRSDRFIHPRVESEIAFLLDHDITHRRPSPRCSPRPSWPMVPVDVLESRHQRFKFTLTDVVADNASAFYPGPIARRPEYLELHDPSHADAGPGAASG